ncbi:hypothetical protein ACFQ3Z_00940 [Streptomyces nogalater]
MEVLLAHARLLQDNGFTVTWGSAGFPTAFVATYGSEGPVLGFNAEYDALPGLSQKKGVGTHDPLVHHYDAYGPTYGAGHGDAHNCLGAGGTAAAIAVARAIRAHGLKATVKLFGSAEEQLVGKAYAVKEGSTTVSTPSWTGTRSPSRCRSGTPPAHWFRPRSPSSVPRATAAPRSATRAVWTVPC